MSEQNDKRLHDWVRQEMDAYRPPYDPANWRRMQQHLHRKRWWQQGVAGAVGVAVLGLLSWLLLTSPPGEKPVTTRPNSKVSGSSSPESTDINTPGATPGQLTAMNTIRKSTRPISRSAKLVIGQTSLNRPLVQTPVQLTALSDVISLSSTLTTQIQRGEPVAYSAEEAAITQQVLTGAFGVDSTSYQTLSRNITQWPNAVIVCDLTTSMYPYTTQLLAWFNQNARKPSVKGAVFFTDCDSLGNQTQPGGPPGRMFVTQTLSSTAVLPVLLNAARNTVRNKDDAENNVESLLFAQHQFPEAKHFVLVADNLSHVKDMALLGRVKKPVHVVLCGTTGGDNTLPFQSDYFTIARQTRGSLHTLEDDLNPAQLSRTTVLRVGPNYYRYNARKKRFKLTTFDHRPRQFLNFLWF